MMKNTFHKIGAVFLMAICTLPALAQMNGTGYYRVRNADRGTDYITIANDFFNISKVISDGAGASYATSTQGLIYSINSAKMFLRNDIHFSNNDNQIIRPSEVIFAKKKNTNSNNHDYNLIAQGTSLLTLTTGLHVAGSSFGMSTNIYFRDSYVTVNSTDGTNTANTKYTASVPLKGYSSETGTSTWGNLGSYYFTDSAGVFSINASNSASNAKWYVEPISYFNVQPDVEFNGKYYTTLYVPFSCTLGENINKAYVITGVTSGILDYMAIASTGDTIPAGTPVILECNSQNEADCKLLLDNSKVPIFTPVNTTKQSGSPRADETTTYYGSTNIMKGTYYCNNDDTTRYTYLARKGSLFNYTYYEAQTQQIGRHYTEPSSKYELGINNNGKLSFVTAQGNQITLYSYNQNHVPTYSRTVQAMPANQAWSTQGGVFPTVATPTFSPASGSTLLPGQTVTISTTESDATISYSTDGGNTWTQGNTVTVYQGMTIQAKAVKEGLYNPSDVATATYTVLQPELAADPALLTIDDNGNYAFYVTGSNLSDNVGVTRTNSGFTPNLSATTGTPVNNNSTYDNGPYWYFTPDNHSLSGQVNVTYDGRALMASDDLTVGTRNAAGTTISTTVHVDYVPDIFIVGDNGTGNWNYANGTQMAEDNGIYTAAVTVPANCCILFARKTGVNYTWDYDYNRIFFGAETNGANWLYNGTNHQGNLELDPRDNNHIKYCPIQFQDAGNYIITVNATNNTFTITGITGSTLAQIEANGTVGNTYAVSDELTGAWYVKYTDENHVVHPLLFAKDQGNASVKTYKDETTGQIDYVKEILGWQDDNWDQSSWVILDFKNVPNGETEAQNLVDHTITPSTIIGTYTDNSNYTIELTGTAPTANGSQLNQYLGYMGPVNGNNPYGSPYQGAIYNTYVTPNFLTTNLNVGQNSGFVATSGPHAGDHLFFVNPKVMEVALVYGVWAGNDVFTVYQPNYDNPEIPTSSVVNAWGTVGSVTANWKYNRNSDSEISYGKPEGIDEHVNDAYFLHALIGRKASNTLRSQGTADGSQVSNEYEIYPLDMPTRAGNWTKVDEVNVLRTVQSVRYYNVMGMESEKPFEGINIVVTRYSDGTTSATKILR